MLIPRTITLSILLALLAANFALAIQPLFGQPRQESLYRSTHQPLNQPPDQRSNQSLFVLREKPDPASKPHPPFPRLAADFEPQRGLVLSVSDWQPHHAPVFQQIVEKTNGHVEVLVLCNNQAQFFMVMGWLESLADKADHLHFALFELDTIWLRDFSPLVAETKDGKAQLLDFLYAGERPKDDRMPDIWAQRSRATPVKVPYTLQGGNLLCNGKHLAIATSRIFVDNAITFPYPTPGMDTMYEGRKIVFEGFLQHCNLEQFIILEHLQEEATKHVDMFATFVSPHEVVVAAVDPRFDPVNAGILDRNARRLQNVKVDGSPLKVYRLPIPPRNGRSWSAFTNVIFANELVLMPIYDSDPKPLVDNAIKLYKSLLPNHTVKTVDITSFKQLQGELHCLSMNLPKFGPWLPNTTSYQVALDAIKSGKIKPPTPMATQLVPQPGLQQPGVPQRSYIQPGLSPRGMVQPERQQYSQPQFQNPRRTLRGQNPQLPFYRPPVNHQKRE
jgi:agmatine/peptidylarginine deiminase